MTDEFTTIDGLKVERSEIVQRMVDYYKAAFGEGNTQLTDFNEGSEVRNFLESVSIPTYELRYWIAFIVRQAFPQTAIKGYLDLLGVMFNCYRKRAVKAPGHVTFTTPAIKSYNITVPKGTLVKTGGIDGVYFVTTEDVVLTASTLTVTAAIEAVVAGVNGNVNAGTIDELPNPIDDLSVTNSSATTGGSDEEDDETFRTRILEAGKSGQVGTEAWFKSMAESITGVHDAKVISNPDGEDYNVKVLVNGIDTPTPTTVINAVLALLTSEDNKVAGLKITVDKPNYISTSVTASITLVDGYSWSTVQANLISNINCIFNGGTTTYGITYSGMNIDDELIRTQIMQVINNTDGVLDYNLTAPSANVTTTQADEVQLGVITLTQV
nr:baseplate J/gp47 family protein [uncultured Methanobacterium sp.]